MDQRHGKHEYGDRSSVGSIDTPPPLPICSILSGKHLTEFIFFIYKILE